MNVTLRAVGALACATVGAAASADQLAQKQLVGPTYMVSVCGGRGSGSGIQPGSTVAMVVGTSNCLSSSGSTLSGSSAQAVTYDWTANNLPQATQAQGAAGFGNIHLASSYSGTNSAGFDLAEATGGWQDVLTINAVNPTNNGKSATLSFNLVLTGQLDAKAIGGNTGAEIALQAWVNHNLTEGSYASSIQSTGNQTQHKDVDSVVPLSVSFTLGQAFTLGVFGSAAALNASASAANAVNVASADFSHTVLWDGISSITLNGSAIDYSVTSASGIDWRNAVSTVPEPTSGALWAVGLCVLGAVARRRLPAASRRRIG